MLDKRECIRNLFDNGNYYSCIEQCDELFINSSDNYNKWFAYCMKAKSYKYLNDCHKAIQICIEALNFASDEFERAWIKWLMAVCYENIDIEKSLNLYDELIYFYATKDIKEIVLSLVSNKAKLTLDEIEAQKVIKEYAKENGANTYYLDGMYENLVFIYIATNQTLQALKYITKIKNKETKQRLIEQLSSVA